MIVVSRGTAQEAIRREKRKKPKRAKNSWAVKKAAELRGEAENWFKEGLKPAGALRSSRSRRSGH